MKGFGQVLVWASLLAPCASAMAQVTLYEHEDFRGRHLSVRGAMANLKTVNFNDTVSALVIERGTWEVCQDADFRGRCEVLGRGEYRSMNPLGLNDKISSLRPVSNRGGYSSRDQARDLPGYAYRQRPNERLQEASITSVRAIYGSGRQQCWLEDTHSRGSRRDKSSVGGAILGGVVGGIIGHQIGDGSGRIAATVGGAAVGAAIGARAGRRDGGDDRHTAPYQNSRNFDDQRGGYDRNLYRCQGARPRGEPTFWDASYTFRGAEHWVRLNYRPGQYITVNEWGEPRG